MIRVDQKKVYPEFLCDFLRKGLGHDQLYRVYTGSTGMVEVTPEEVDAVVVPPLPSTAEQERLSRALRQSEVDAREIAQRSTETLVRGENGIRAATMPKIARNNS